MSSNPIARRRQGCLVLAVFVAACGFQPGCGRPEPVVLNERAVEVSSSEPPEPKPLYRVWLASGEHEERKVRVGFDHQEVLFVPPAAVVRNFAPDAGGMLDVDEILDGVALGDADRVGILVGSLYGSIAHEIGLEGLGSGTKVSAVPKGAIENAGSAPRLETALVTVKPLLPQPSEYRSNPLILPDKAAIHLSIALDAESTDSLEFRVDALRGGARTTLFRETVSPSSEASWKTVDVPIPETLRGPVEFAFAADRPGTRSILGGGDAAVANPLWGDVYIYQTEARSGQPPNVLMISIDTLRADRLGLYGFGKGASPNLDALGAESVVFDRCYAPTSWTMPSHAAAFTGLHLATHPRSPERFGYGMNPQAHFIAEYARDAGYLTAGFSEGLLVGAEYGFAQGYGTYSDGPSAHPLPPASAEATFERGKEWMDLHRNVPFFLFLHTYQVHSPYEPPEPYRSQFYDGPLYRLVPELNVKTDEERAACEPLYLGEVAYTDHVIGELIAWMRGDGLLERTLVVIFSDHGEELLDHGDLSHGYTIYNEVLHVPLILRFPGAHPPVARVARPVALGDLFGTLVDFMGIESAHQNDSQSLLGLSGWPSTSPAYDRNVITAQLNQFQYKYLLLSAQDSAYKYIAATHLDDEASPLRDYLAMVAAGTPLEPALLDYLGGVEAITYEPVLDPQRTANYPVREMLYDLESDPGERSAIQNPRVTAELRDQLNAELRRVLEDAKNIDLGGAVAAPLTKEQREELEAVGYLR